MRYAVYLQLNHLVENSRRASWFWKTSRLHAPGCWPTGQFAACPRRRNPYIGDCHGNSLFSSNLDPFQRFHQWQTIMSEKLARSHRGFVLTGKMRNIKISRWLCWTCGFYCPMQSASISSGTVCAVVVLAGRLRWVRQGALLWLHLPSFTAGFSSQGACSELPVSPQVPAHRSTLEPPVCLPHGACAQVTGPQC